jgi:hypothetical protein
MTKGEALFLPTELRWVRLHLAPFRRIISKMQLIQKGYRIMTSICVVGKWQSRFALKNMVTTLMILDLEVTQLIARFHTTA